MTIAQLDIEQRHTTDAGDDLFHYFCCDENRSICGLDISDVPISDIGDDLLCVVCDDLSDGPCSDPDCPDRSP